MCVCIWCGLYVYGVVFCGVLWCPAEHVCAVWYRITFNNISGIVLENELPFYLEDVPLATRGRMYLQHEETPRNVAER